MIVFLPGNDTWEVKMKPVEFIIREGDEHLTNQSGLGERIDAVMLPGCREPKIPNGDIVKSMVGLLCIGKLD